MPKKNLVIFSGANKLIDDIQLTNNLKLIACNLNINKYNIWYGGGNAGIMGVIPKKFNNIGGNVFSVNAKQFLKYDDTVFGETIIKDTFTERQNSLVEKGDIYLCLPGGVGTVSELFDVLVNNDVNGKNLKIILYSYNNYFDDIINFIKNNIKSGYIRPNVMNNIIVYTDHIKIVDYLNNLN